MMQNNAENLSPQVVKRLTKELADLTANPLEDVKVLVNESDVTDIQAIISGPGNLKILLSSEEYYRHILLYLIGMED